MEVPSAEASTEEEAGFSAAADAGAAGAAAADAGAAGADAGAAASTKMLELRATNDGDKVLFISEAASKLCKTIVNLREDLGDDDSHIPVPSIQSPILSKVVEFCTHYCNEPPEMSEEQQEAFRSSPIEGWDKDFLPYNAAGALDVELNCKLMAAANYLDVKRLLDLTAKALAHEIKARSRPNGDDDEGIREMFGILEPFSEELKAQVRAENPWCVVELPGDEPGAPAAAVAPAAAAAAAAADAS